MAWRPLPGTMTARRRTHRIVAARRCADAIGEPDTDPQTLEIIMSKLRTHVASLLVAGTSVVSVPLFAMPLQSNLGTPVHNGVPDVRPQARSADRTVAIDADTKHVNVVGGQVVRFIVADNTFEWLFDTYDTSLVFDLKDIAPAGILGDREIKVYVSPDPLYSNG
jgi:hypothetical protein